MKSASSIQILLVLGGMLVLCCGCGGERLSPAALAARKALQFERPQEALDKLSEGSGDQTAEGHYLRACALEQLDRASAAKAEADLALAAAPKNPKYKGYSLRLKLFEGDESAIEPLLQLHDEHPSAAAVSLYAVFAYQAKHVKQRSDGKLRAARAQLDNAQASLKTALSLAAEIPESQRELVEMAIWFEQPADALKLIDVLLREEPDGIALLRQRVRVLLLSKQSAETISTAATLYKRQDRTESAAVEFANLLNRLPPSPAVFEQYDSLREHFPANTAILLRQCWSIGKGGRVEDACQELAKAIEQQTDPRRRQTIAQSLVAIPLEMNDAEVAAAQLKKFRNQIGNDQMLVYFEGQLAALRRDYALSVEKMQEVVNIYRTDSSASPALARVALGRIRQVLLEQQLTEQVRKAAELTLRRAGLNRYDEADVRGEARSLLNLLESEGGSERTPREGPAVLIDSNAPTPAPR
ncbi:MAG: tetratricopeptide repeat protein [Planctomycetaceae bacterium]